MRLIAAIIIRILIAAAILPITLMLIFLILLRVAIGIGKVTTLLLVLKIRAAHGTVGIAGGAGLRPRFMLWYGFS